MTKEDVPLLKLEAPWMRDRYYRYLESKNGPALVMEDEGGLLCAFGAVFLWEGTCEVWFSLIRQEHSVAMIRTVLRTIEQQASALHIRRMQATVRCDSEPSQTFIESLGFLLETPFGMKNYNPDGSAALLYSRSF